MATIRKQFITKTDVLIHVPSDDSSGGCVPQTNQLILYEICSGLTRPFFLKKKLFKNMHSRNSNWFWPAESASMRFCAFHGNREILHQKSTHRRAAKSSHATHRKMHKLAHSWFTFMLQSELKEWENFHNKIFPLHTDKRTYTCESLLLVPPHAPFTDVPNNGALEEEKDTNKSNKFDIGNAFDFWMTAIELLPEFQWNNNCHRTNIIGSRSSSLCGRKKWLFRTCRS